MLEIFLFAELSYCTFELAIKTIEKIDYNILYLNWFQDYHQQGTQYNIT